MKCYISKKKCGTCDRVILIKCLRSFGTFVIFSNFCTSKMGGRKEKVTVICDATLVTHMGFCQPCSVQGHSVHISQHGL